MYNKSLVYILIAAFFLVFSACSSPVSDDQSSQAIQDSLVSGVIIARVNGYPITLEDFEEEIDSYNSLIPPDRPDLKITTSEQKVNYLKNEVIKRIFLYQEAKTQGLDKDFEVRRVLEKTKMQLLVNEIIKREMQDVSVMPSEVDEYYASLPPEYKKEPDTRRVSEIVTKDKSEANNLLVRLLNGEDFANLARQYSTAPSASKGGDLGFISPGFRPKEFEQMVFSDILDIGQISSIFKGPEGYYIVRVEEERIGKRVKLSDMQNNIEAFLLGTKQREKIDRLMERLSRNANIDIKEELIQ